MLSDAANMVGGETAFRKGDGSVAKVKFPGAGWAIMMQVPTACRVPNLTACHVIVPLSTPCSLQGLNVLHSVTEVLSQSGEFGERMSMVKPPADVMAHKGRLCCQASKWATNVQVTSYQPRDHQAPQNGRIRAIHCLASDADRPQMLAEYAFWRLEVLSKRMADLACQVAPNALLLRSIADHFR